MPVNAATLFVGGLVVVCPFARAQETRLPVDNLQPLLIAAIDSPSGTARGELSGKLGAAMMRLFKSDKPVLVDVSTLYRFKQAGCSRLNVRLSQGAVVLNDASKPKDMVAEIGINYCRDGSPPNEFIDELKRKGKL
jgi:hypothetical protein